MKTEEQAIEEYKKKIAAAGDVNIKDAPRNVYVLFDYDKKVVYSIEGFNRELFIDKLPANTREKNIFIENFYKKGRRKVKFAEYKAFDSLFHGTAKYKKQYDTITLNRDQYLSLLAIMSEPENECNNLSKALDLSLRRANSNHYEYLHKKNSKELTKETLKTIFENINRQIQNM